MRKANIKDIVKIEEILLLAKSSLLKDGVDQWQKSSPNRHMILEQIEKGEGFVYEVDNEVAAYAHIHDHEEANYQIHADRFKGKDYYTVHTFMADTRGKFEKPGKKFMEEIIDCAKEMNKDSIRLDTHDDNFRMKGMLDKFGFTYIGVIQIDEEGVKKDRNAYELTIS